MLPAIFILFFLTICGGQESSLPSYITPCHANDPKLNECITNEARRIKPQFVLGDKERGVPPLDPLYVGDVNSSISVLTLINHDVVIRGIKDLEIKKVTMNIDKGKGKIVLHGNITMTSKYEINGQYLLFKINGKGKSSIKLERTLMTIDFKFKVVKDDKGDRYLEMYDVKNNFDIGNAKLYMDGLLNNDKTFVKTFNELLNRNWRDLIKEFGPSSVNVVSDKTTEILNKYFATVKYEDLLL